LSEASREKLLFAIQTDCEATQPAVNDKALGERASRGLADLLETHGLRGTFYVLPTEAEAHTSMYRELHDRGHEIGLHLHPACHGYEEFLGVYGPDMQRQIVSEATEAWARAIGSRPVGICIGYASSNDCTCRVLHELGYRHGMTKIPTRVLPECASVHAGAPLDVHYAHPHNRTLAGGLDFVEVSGTIDPDSRMWGGKHPQDLRVELVDAKNHWYTIDKSVRRQIAAAAPVKYALALTHNIFEYGDASDFRRQTLESIIAHTFSIAGEHGLECAGATAADIAKAYRAAVPLPDTSAKLDLDRRGHGEPQVSRGDKT